MGEIEWPAVLYPQGHPYAHTVIGTHEDLEAAKLQEVKDFFATWYVPNNASIVIAGDFDPAKVKPVVERYFAGIAKKDLPARTAPAPVAAPEKKLVTVPDQVDLPQLTLLFHSPAGYADGDVECRLLASLLADGESSRLYVKLVKAGLAQDVAAMQYPTQLGGTFLIQTTASEGVAMDKIRAVIEAELADLAKTPPTAAEMERLHNQSEYGFLAGLEPLQDRAEMLNRYWAYTGSPDYLDKDLARYRASTADGLSKAAATWLSPSLAGAVLVVPEDQYKAPAPTTQGGK
jgi:predicted Zn-dependent peptidase